MASRACALACAGKTMATLSLAGIVSLFFSSSISTAEAPAAETASGATIYANYCVECHGARLEGARGPSLRDIRWRAEKAATSLAAAIREGAPARGMPSFGNVLPDTALQAVLLYVLEQNAVSVVASEAASSDTKAHSLLHSFRLTTVVSIGLRQSRSMAILPDGEVLVTDASGLRRIPASTRALGAPVAGLPPHDLLEEVAPHPDYQRNGWLYLTQVCSTACGHANRHVYSLLRGRIRDGRWVDGRTLATYGDGDLSYGVSKLAFDGEGYLWLTLSGAEQPGQDPEAFIADIARPASLASHRGKIFRLHEDGSVPRDGPFVEARSANQAGALIPSAVWSLGHRGLSGLHYDRVTRTLWATEHGPWGGDELNRIIRGGDYGWPRTSYGYHYGGARLDHAAQIGLESPLFHWTPSIGVSGVLVYRGNSFLQWRGDLFVGALGDRIGRTLYRFRLVEGHAQLYQYPADENGRLLRDSVGRTLPRVARFEEVLPDIGRIRDLREGPDGFIYLLLENPDRIVRLEPAET